MGVIDGHVHIYPPDLNLAPAQWARDRQEQHWSLLCARVRGNGQPVQGFPSVDELLRAMDEAGVERAVLQCWYWEKHDTCAWQNRFYAECIRQHADRLSALAAFHPSAGHEAVRAELLWAKQHDFCGLGELSPHSQIFPIDDEVWSTALALAGELSLPVTLHVTEPLGRGYPGRVLTPLDDFVTLARKHPTTTFVLAHWGAKLPFDAHLGATITSLRNVYYDTAASPLLYDISVFREFFDRAGYDRVLFGSDFPLILFPAREQRPGIASFLHALDEAGLTSEERVGLLRENAKALYGF